ncbi:type III restriction-modification system endonuclease [Streptococcus moroccensis]|uniref:Type III restriction enzyme n=1 Tax=Streptococcus moroccensis TaxID=1451356 RepID=A0ABT9YQT2_9STRE|nr:DEAD/DEAH box helicase family protein [Streptococcus moroccensis]MDQ0221658.1 type III restriction enzyme [Streptococcus moroccensis]
MKLQFKHQQFQLDAVAAIADIFQGQGRREGLHYMADPGRDSQSTGLDLIHDAYRNAPIALTEEKVHQAVKAKQIQNGLEPSEKLSLSRIAGRPSYNLTIEMETGTGKTYTYIRTIMELHQRYGWIKFIIVVPSVAIREGVLKSFETMQDHFQMEYGKKPRYFVYNSSRLGDLDHFANSSDIQVMIINSQAFNATGKDANRIHMKQESFKWRKPIDVIAQTNPILIIDEPQSVSGPKTKEGLAAFKPLMTLRYSATHKDKYDMVYRLDAMDAYNKRLVKKIAVKAVEAIGTTGTAGYLYLQEIIPQKSGTPKARIEYEVKGATGIRRKTQVVASDFDLYAESNQLEAYRGMNLTDFDARPGVNSIQVGPNQRLLVGEVMGDRNEDDLRRIQIRETIKSHLQREALLYQRGIKVLSLFFIDEVAKYRVYDDQKKASNGSYARFFEEEYQEQVEQYLAQTPRSAYSDYLREHQEARTVHAGYFSIDKHKKTGQSIFVESKIKRGETESSDQDAYDLIMRDKERLLSFDEPVRFVFSHSALKEGWDNPNVFQICTLKQSNAEMKKRQEIGRGMRLAVDQLGVRQDEELLGEEVHAVNKLTIIANESYDEFSRQLQEEIKKVLAGRPGKVDVTFLMDKVLEREDGEKLVLTAELAKTLHHQLIVNGYLDEDDQLTDKFYNDKDQKKVQIPDVTIGFEEELLKLLSSVYNPQAYPTENASEREIVFKDEINEENIARQEFQKLWGMIQHKTRYRIQFSDDELIDKAVTALNDKLSVKKIAYQITEASAEKISQIQGLELSVSENARQHDYIQSTQITVKYDLLGQISDRTGLTRQTVAEILSKIDKEKFQLFRQNPEDFLLKVSRLIEEEKATQVIQHIEYNLLDESYDTGIFYDNPATGQRSDRFLLDSQKGVYHYVKVDSNVEKEFKDALEQYEDVRVYAKLPSEFKIPTPLGDYNPDWAIAFKEGTVKRIYFVAETKGSLSSLQLKGAEIAKITCAKAHFEALKRAGIIHQDHIYDVVDSYKSLIDIVKA